MTIDKLARMTADGLAEIKDQMVTKEEFVAGFNKMNHTLKNILDVVLEIPSKKAFERLENKVQSIDLRLTAVERKVK